MRYIKVALNLPVDKFFHYEVPEKLREKVEEGKRVFVPFREKKLLGFIVGEGEEKEGLRKTLDIYDEVSPLSSSLLELGKWLSSYYFCSLGQALFTIFPLRYPFKLFPFHTFTSQEKKPLPGKRKIVEGRKEKRRAFSFKLVREKIKEGGKVIYLVPEVGYIGYFKKNLENFGKVEIFHSSLTPKKRFEVWCKIKKGEIDIILGTRSAIFAPFSKPCLLVVEEEENPAYKHKETPRYDLREVAERRREKEGMDLVFLSSSPSLRTRERGGERVNFSFSQPKVQFEVVDLKKEKDKVFSSLLYKAIKEEVEKGGKVFLFLNRKGLANFVLCTECGEVIRCPGCNIGLTLHLRGRLLCHWCGYEEKAPIFCPSCQGVNLRGVGIGTERLERMVRKVFPGVKVTRIDADIPFFLEREMCLSQTPEIVIGTGLALKEPILLKVKVMGIIFSDSFLNLPDFRRGEVFFGLLKKIEDLIEEGKIIIQTYNPQHYTLQALFEGSESFYEKERSIRQELDYPPFSHWVRLLWEGKRRAKVEEVSKKYARRIKKARFQVLGPSPCPWSKLKGKYRYHLLIKTQDVLAVNNFLRQNYEEILSPGEGVKGTVDVDPINIT